MAPLWDPYEYLDVGVSPKRARSSRRMRTVVGLVCIIVFVLIWLPQCFPAACTKGWKSELSCFLK